MWEYMTTLQMSSKSEYKSTLNPINPVSTPMHYINTRPPQWGSAVNHDVLKPFYSIE